MSQKSLKTAAELESIITAELRENLECDSAGVVAIRRMGLSWNGSSSGRRPKAHSDCNQILAEIAARLRQEFDLAD